MEYFISDLHWLWIFWIFIGAVFVVLGIVKLVDEVRLMMDRRRYRRAKM
jgi:hypothetical protein